MNEDRNGVDGDAIPQDELDLLDALLDAEDVKAPSGRSIAKLGAKVAPLSPAQRRMWFLHEVDRLSTAYTISGAALLRGELDVDALEAALAGVVSRHEALRTTFEAEEGEPHQVVHEAAAVSLERLAGFAGGTEEAIARVAERLAGRSWDLVRGPLLRAALVDMAPDRHLLVVAMHHIVADGGSVEVMLRELGALYRAHAQGTAPALSEPPIQYADWAVRQIERLASGVFDPQLEFWRRRLAGVPRQLDLPVDTSGARRSGGTARRGGTVRFEIDGPSAVRIAALARSLGATPFAALLACFEALLGRWSGQCGFLVGIPVANRLEEETAGLIGLFVNTIPLRADLSGDPRMRDFVLRARNEARSALANGEIPFDQIVDAVGAGGTAGTTPLFQVMFAYRDVEEETLELPGLTVELVPVDDGTAKFDLTLSVEASVRADRPPRDPAGAGERDRLACALEYDADLLDRETARRLVAHFLCFAQTLAAGGEERISEVFLEDLDNTARALPKAETVHALFEAHAVHTPDDTAIVAGRKRASDPELDARATPANALEEIVAGIWAEMLGLDRVGATENFFDLGGHSIIATRVVARLARALGAEVPLRALFDAPTVRGLVRIIDTDHRPAPPPIVPMAGPERETLSYAQQRLWFLDRLEPQSAGYNIANAIRIEGALDAASLSSALTEIVRRHEALRTRFEETSAGPRQVVDAPSPVVLSIEDLSALATDEVEREAEAARRAGSAARRPFDLARGPVLRASLLRLGPEDHVLVLVVHHIASDGWSMGVLVNELAAAYAAFVRGEAPRLPALAVQYADWAAWQRAWLETGAMERELSWWRTELHGLEPLDLPTDRPRPAKPTYAGASLPVRLHPELVGRLARLARSEGATLHMALLAAFAAVLGRWSGRRDLGIGTPVANRTREEAEPLIGFFVNSLVVRARLGGARLAYRELLARIREAALGAYANQDVPFERVVEALQPERDLSRTPLFQVMFVLQSAPAGALDLGDLKIRPFEAPTDTSTFDLTVSLAPVADPAVPGGAEALDGFVEFSTELFEEETIRRFWDRFVRMLESVARDPLTEVHRVRLLGDAERAAAVEVWSGRREVHSADRLVAELFAERAAADPGCTAAVLGERRVSYGEIDDRSARLASLLAAAGVGPESRVGLCVDRSPEMLVGMMAVLRAGGAFVPLDPAYPTERLAFMLEDASARVVLATSTSTSSIAGSGRVVIRLDDEGAYMSAPLAPARRPSPEGLAYIIYTSGTTGRPKGVMVSHRALASAYAAWEALYGLNGIRSHLQMAGIAFDVCTGDVVRALCSGGTLVFCERERLLDPKRLFELARSERVEVADFVPAVLRPLAAEARARGERLDAFRVAVVGSDVWSASEIEGLCAVFGPGTRFGNSYGVTEATIDSTCWFVGDGDAAGGSPPIGRPLAHATAYVLDEALEPVPSGTTGVLWLGGPGVARGYAGRPDLTAERFVPDPFGEPGARMYLTGDRARYLSDGRIVFAGRADDQVKIRGVRVEPAEVEVALAAQEDVAACAVVARKGEAGARLAAYVVPRTPDAFDAEETRRLLRKRLPEAMVPSAIVVLEALPLTPNGKIDRRRLPEPEWGTGGTHEPPRTATEAAVAAAFADVLDLERVGAGDDFFALGGHSLLATRVVSRLRAVLGVEVPLRTIFEAPAVRDLAARLESLGGSPAPPPIERASEEERRPASYAQARLWFLDRLDPASAAYNLPSRVRLSGSLDVAAFARAFGEVVERHEALRTRFALGPRGPEQVIDPPAPIALGVIDVTHLPEQERGRETERLTTQEARRPFDLERGPLFRVGLLRLGPAEHLLLLTLHHIAADGWSLGVILRELSALYGAHAQGTGNPLAELPVQYADWAAWQRRWLGSGEMDRQLGWWRAELDGAATLAIPSDRPRPARPCWSGAALEIRLDATLRERLERLGREEGATLHMVLLAGYVAVLSRWSGQRDIVVGTPVANRRSAEAEPLIGFFVNTLPVRARLGGRGLSFRGLVRRTREAALGAYANQDVPYERLVEELHPDRHLGHNPVVQSLFALQNAPIGEISLPGLSLVYEEPETGVTRFDLELFLAETAAGLEGLVHYATELFDRETIERFAANFASVLDAGSLEPDRALGEVAAPAPDQRERLLVTWNALRLPRLPHDDPPLAHALFERHAARAPGDVAASIGSDRLTYGELNAQANRLARLLRRRGIGVEDRVAVCLPRSLDMIVALLAILKAGGAYVPVDPEYPRERVALILAEAGASALLTRSDLPGVPRGGAQVVRLDEARAELLGEAGDDLGLDVPEDALVYAVYTSGSTGSPKGVAMSHRAAANLLAWQRRDSAAGGNGRAPRTLQFASLSFDVSFQEIFSTLTAGGEIVLVSEDERRDAPRLLRIVREREIERLFLPWVALQQIAETAALEEIWPAHLREVDTAGEQLRITPAIAAMFAHLPGCRLVNHYGPSETHLVTAFALGGDPSLWPELPPIGRPIANAPVYLLDDEWRLVPIGAPGEIFVGGAGLARGYLGQPDMTAERFLPDPFSEAPGARLYRTGDLARFRGDGTLEFLGRSDLQVKVRGYRVEPGEVEVALARHPAVRQAIVRAHEHRGGKRLVAWVVPAAPSRIAPAELRAHLASTLPEYMVPSAIVLLDALPLTPNGKVDLKGLPEPDFGATAGHVAPRTAEEEIVCGIIAEVLELPCVGAEDDFFELGGHSLLATQVVSRVRAALGVELPLRTLFEQPTPAAIAAAAVAARRHGAPPPPLGRAPEPERRALSYAQRRLWFLDRLEPGSAVYALPVAVRLEGALEVAALGKVLTEIVRRHEALRTRYVEGGEGPEQIVDPAREVRVVAEDVPGRNPAERDTEAHRLLEEEATRPFDLARGPVLRVRLLRLGTLEHVLLLVVHHISADGWSMGILMRELGILYGAFAAGGSSPLPEPMIQYADWAAWQRAWLEGGELERQLIHWRETLEGAPRALSLPTDRARPETATWRGTTRPVRLPPELCKAAERFARSEGATLHMALLAAYAWAVMRRAGQAEVIVGTPVANRRAAEAEALVGFFVNTLAVRVNGGGRDTTWRVLLARVREASLGAYANQDVPFERVVEELQPERVLNRAPLFQTAFALQNARLPQADLAGLSMKPFEIETRTAKFDLMLVLEEEAGGLQGAFEYNTDLFDAATIDGIFSSFESVLRGGLAAPDVPLATAPMQDDARALRAQGRRNATAVRFEGPGLLHELVERQVARVPSSPALASGGETWTYGQVEARANRLARHLLALGVGPDRRVALLLERSPEVIVALLAVLKAGGAYVPLEPEDPPARLRGFIDNSGATVVVTESRFLDTLADAPAREEGRTTEPRVVVLDRDEEVIAAHSAERPACGARPENLAYVIYTSGSTGWPKGVGVEHRQIANYVKAAVERLGVQAGWRFALLSSLAADLGHTAIFPVLASGGCLHVLPRALALDAPGVEAYFAEHAIDGLKIVPSHLLALSSGARPGGVLPRRLLVLGGEATPGARLRALREAAPGCLVANHYGPTEATVGAVAGFPDEADATRSVAPLGRPLANVRAYVLDENGRPVPDGVPGEMFLGGAGVARGYLGRPDATAERFLPDPFTAEQGARMYRTGDRARWLQDGRIEFLGRADAQVKVRGFRVEPGEVEAAIVRHPDVRAAAVVARGSGPGGTQLVAYVVPEPRLGPTVHGLARRRLPDGPAVAELNRNETDYLHREIFDLRAYVRHGITLEDGDTVVDVGANIGLFTVFVSLACASPRIFAFEPNPQILPILRANAAVYAPRATIVGVGLSDRDREAAFTFFPGFSLLSGLYADAAMEKRVVKSFLESQESAGVEGAASLSREAEALLGERFAGRTFDVTLKTLSDVMDEHRIDRIGLLKVNVEKAELEVLRGLREEDWARIDQAVVEVDLTGNLAPIVALFESHDFALLVDQDPLLERTDLRYVYAVRRGSGRKLVPGAPPSVPRPVLDESLLTPGALRAHLAQLLPGPMQPAAWVLLEALPLTPNGKLDRARLPEPRPASDAYVAPRGELERAIAVIWSEALALPRVGVHDNFFDLGGHSILLARVHARIRGSLGTEIPVVDLFRFPTIASLAARLANPGSGEDASRLDKDRGMKRRDAARARARRRRAAVPDSNL